MAATGRTRTHPTCPSVSSAWAAMDRLNLGYRGAVAQLDELTCHGAATIEVSHDGGHGNSVQDDRDQDREAERDP